MIIHAAIHWTEHKESDMCPLALSHAMYLHNELHIMMSHLTPTYI